MQPTELADVGDEGAVAAMMALVMGMRASEIVSRVVRDLDDDGRLLWIFDSTGLRPPLRDQMRTRRPDIRCLPASFAEPETRWSTRTYKLWR